MTRIPEQEIKVGVRVAVFSPADAYCDHDILWGVGEVSWTDPHPDGRTEVRFDDGSGGMFPRELLCYPERA